MKEEGYIKFSCTWLRDELSDQHHFRELNYWRRKLYDQGLIGAYEDGTGYGNISSRLADNVFMITGTKTGDRKQLTTQHYTRVTGYDVKNNTLTCQGPIQASSESLTHALIYETLPWVNAVVHVHHRSLWNKLLNILPTTSAKAAYGTPEMALEISRLITSAGIEEKKILVMAGHEDGLISFGEDLEAAATQVMNYL